MSEPESSSWTVPKSGLLLVIEAPDGAGFDHFRSRFSPDQLFDWRDQPGDPAAPVSPRLEGRLQAGGICVLFGPLWRAELRRSLRRLAERYFRPTSALHLHPPRGRRRSGGPPATEAQVRARLEVQNLRPVLEREGYFLLQSVDSAGLERLEILLTPLPGDRRELSGPFDMIGDLHGCLDELNELMERLGYRSGRHPHGRTPVFVGDLTDRGPESLACLRKVRALVSEGRALCVLGNHDEKLIRFLEGRRVDVSRGLQTTVAELERASSAELDALRDFLQGLPEHLLLDDGALVVAHAGLPESMHGGVGRQVRSHCLYGKTTGRLGSDGLPERLDWAADYQGQARVVYGHTPVRQAVWRHGTINIDTGCVFGGALTALRYPEIELVSVPARRTYAGAVRPW